MQIRRIYVVTRGGAICCVDYKIKIRYWWRSPRVSGGFLRIYDYFNEFVSRTGQLPINRRLVPLHRSAAGPLPETSELMQPELCFFPKRHARPATTREGEFGTLGLSIDSLGAWVPRPAVWLGIGDPAGLVVSCKGF